MIRKKELLARILYHTKFINFFNRFAGNKLIVFNYHRIRPESHKFSTPFDDDVFGPTISQFKKQIKWLKENAKIVSEKEVIDIINDKKDPSGLSVLITFDDGYRDNYSLAYPVLKELQVPTIFFIPTNLINIRQLGWWDIIAYMIKNTKRLNIIYEDKEFLLQNGRKEAIRFFQQRMKMEKQEKTQGLLKSLEEICELPLPDIDSQDREIMTWEEIKEVSRNNVTIGSHTHTHRVLSTLNPKAQLEEITKSKTILEQQTGKQVSSIAFPVGNYQHFTEKTQHLVNEVGYQLGFSYNTGINEWKTITPFDIKRIAAPNNLTMFSATTVFPKLFSWKT